MLLREQTTIRLPVDLKEQIQREADRRGDSFNGYVVQLLHLGLKVSRPKIQQ